MHFLRQLFETLIHLDQASMNNLANLAGPWLYVVLFLIIFAETGLVALPLLPGDSLLFAVGALAAHPGSPINIVWTSMLLVVAAVVGDAVNYAIGARLGPKVFSSEKSFLFNKKHLLEAQGFYEKYGAKTIILARFVPIVRTFAPFVAGIGRMNYARFAIFNITGGATWVLAFLLAGWWFGGLPAIQRNFKLVILAIIVISVFPAVVEIVRKRMGRGRASGGVEKGMENPAAEQAPAIGTNS